MNRLKITAGLAAIVAIYLAGVFVLFHAGGAIGLVEAQLVQVQCAVGSSPLQALITRNFATSALLYNVCVDVNGNINFPSGSGFASAYLNSYDLKSKGGAVGDGRASQNCTWTGGAATTVTDVFNSPFLPTDVGKKFFANNLTFSQGTNDFPTSTILAVNSPSSITLDTPSTRGSAGLGNELCIWYTKDDTAAVQAAVAAAKTASFSFDALISAGAYLTAPLTISVPPGMYVLNTPASCLFNFRGATGNEMSPSIVGAGIDATTFVLGPLFTNCPAMNGGHGAFLEAAGRGGSFTGFTLTSAGFQFSFAANFMINFSCSLCRGEKIFMTAIGGTNAINGYNVAGSNVVLNQVGGQDTAFNGAPAFLANVNGAAFSTWRDSLLSNNNASNLQIQNEAGRSSGQFIGFHNMIIDECGSGSSPCTQVLNSKDVSFDDNSLFLGGVPQIMTVDGTSEVRFTASNLGVFGSCAAANFPALTIASGGIVWATETQFRHCGTNNSIEGSGTFNDLGGNNDVGNAGSVVSLASTVKSIFPLTPGTTTQLGIRQTVAQSSAGGLPTFATTGFGTGPVVAGQLGSTDAAGNVLITAGTTPGSTGTVTLTFTVNNGAYGTNAPVCQASLQNGTGTWGNTSQEPVISSPTTTSVVFNWTNSVNGVATNLTAGQTYSINWNCYGK